MNNLFNLNSYFKFLSRNKIYTTIEIFGLSISLMFIIIIVLYNEKERSIDQFNTKADRIYALGIKQSVERTISGAHWRIQPMLQDKFPDIESTCAIALSSVPLKSYKGEEFKTNIMFTDSTFYSMFDFQLLHGDRRTTLNSPEKVVISEKLARQLFGDSNPIGQSIEFKDTISLTVSAIMQPIDRTCILNKEKQPADMIANFDMMKYINFGISKEDVNMSNGIATDIYLLEKEGSNLQNKRADIESFLKEAFWVYRLPGVKSHTELVPLSELYFSNAISMNGNHINGNKSLVNILLIVGFAILLFALMNYINLTVAQAGFRAKENGYMASFRK